jgi:hypothetical protein
LLAYCLSRLEWCSVAGKIWYDVHTAIVLWRPMKPSVDGPVFSTLEGSIQALAHCWSVHSKSLQNKWQQAAVQAFFLVLWYLLIISATILSTS